MEANGTDVQTRVDKIREYFYGPSGDLSPHSTLIDFADISIYRIGGGPRAPSSALPIGAERTITPTKLVEVQPSQEIVHSIIGVSHAKTPEALLETNLAGFLYMYAPQTPSASLSLSCCIVLVAHVTSLTHVA